MQSWDYLECVKSWEYIKSSYVLHNLKKGKENNKIKRKIKKNKEMTWMMMWLNRSVATLIATLQLLDIYRLDRWW